MKSKGLVSMILALALTCALMGCGNSGNTSAPASGSSGSDTVYKITIGHGTAEDTAQHQCALAIKEYLESNSDGRFNVTIYPNSQLGANREMTESILDGNLTMMLTSSGTQTNFVPSSAVFDVPYAWENEEAMQNTIYDENFLAALDKEHQAAGLKLIMLTHSSFRQLSANKAVHTPADCAGLIIRTQENKFQMKTWTLCGANPTPLAFNEVYTALQQGTVEAQDNPLELFTSQKFYEQQTHFMKVNYIGYVGMWIVNLDFYNSLPDDLRKLFDEACKVGRDRNEEYSKTSNTEKEDFLAKNGITIVELNEEEHKAFKDVTAPVWDEIKAAITPDVWNAFINTLK